MFKIVFSYLRDAFAILYPELCFSCEELLVKGENVLCTSCILHLPRTNFHKYENHKMEKQFWGKVLVENVAAFFYFEKKGKVQRLMHQLKYQKHPEIGERVGSLYAAELLSDKKFNSLDYIIAIPLHKKKMKIRGYNQSLCFANGLAMQFKIPVLKNRLIRTKNNATQTRKSRFERYKNVAMVFKIKNPSGFINKHVLLVDDVMTTGSTLTACIQLFNQIEGCKISVLTIAYAE